MFYRAEVVCSKRFFLTAALLLVASQSLCCMGFGIPNPFNVIQKLTTNTARAGVSNTNNNEDAQEQQQLLQELKIQASTTPRLAYARTERIPSLLISSLAPILRRASGVFPCNYNVQLIPRNTTIYTYIAFDSIHQQLSETGYANIPKLPLILYDNEADADSKLVREACSMLSLVVTMYPMPMNGKRYRDTINPNEYINPKAISYPNNNDDDDSTFPYFYDPNTSVKLAGSRRIIDYLFAKYGPPNQSIPDVLQQPTSSSSNSININIPKLTAFLGVSLIMNNAGGIYNKNSNISYNHNNSNNNNNMQPIILYAYEGSPFCKVVREILCSYEIVHTIYYTPRGSIHRQQLYDITKRFQVPYIQDPNTNIHLFESEAIVEYLQKQYGIQ